MTAAASPARSGAQVGLQLFAFVNQAYIDGTNKPFNVALVVPDHAALERCSREQGIDGSTGG